MKPRGASRQGPNRLLATHYAERLATSHLAQPAEPPYADPHVRWCGRGGRATVPPIPIGCRSVSTGISALEFSRLLNE